jgi:hypothetical protein
LCGSTPVTTTALGGKVSQDYILIRCATETPAQFGYPYDSQIDSELLAWFKSPTRDLQKSIRTVGVSAGCVRDLDVPL